MNGTKVKIPDVSGFNEKTVNMDELNKTTLKRAINNWLDESPKHTITKLAADSKVSRQTLYNIIDGTHSPTLEKTNKILNVIGSHSGIYKNP